MNVQVINSVKGQPEYVLLPINVYQALRKQIEAKLNESSEYVPFILEDYVDNPVALARMKANFTQEELAKAMDVSQAYISKLETQSRVTSKTLEKVNIALAKVKKRKK